MTDREFTIELRRGLIIIIRAMVLRFGLSWDWFKPRTETVVIYPAAANVTLLGVDRT